MTASDRVYIEITKEGITGHLPMQVVSDGDGYVANCPPLELVAQGDTTEEAEAALKEAIGMFLQELVRMGTLEHVLVSEMGWRKTGSHAVPAYELPPPAVVQNLSIGPIPVTA